MTFQNAQTSRYMHAFEVLYFQIIMTTVRDLSTGQLSQSILKQYSYYHVGF